MKLKISLLLLIYFTQLYSQKIEQQIGEIKIVKEGYYFDTYLKSKKSKTEKIKFYFDDFGKKLEKIKYGKQHSNKLNVIGSIEQYSYKNGNLIIEKHWISNCYNNNFTVYNTEYIYDENNFLIKQVFSNPISKPFIYKYEKNKTEIHSDNYYIQKKFDDQKRIIECNQISEETNKIRWQYLFFYKGNCRITNFQTYYGDGKENSKKVIIYYDFQNRKVSEEIINYYKTKIIYNYFENGIIKKIEEYESSLEENNFKLLRLTKFKIVRKPQNLKLNIVETINKELIDNDF